MSTKKCWVCEMAGIDTDATHDGCKHLTTLVPQDAARYGLCDECFAVGPCPECDEEKREEKRLAESLARSASRA